MTRKRQEEKTHHSRDIPRGQSETQEHQIQHWKWQPQQGGGPVMRNMVKVSRPLNLITAGLLLVGWGSRVALGECVCNVSIGMGNMLLIGYLMD